MRMRLDNAEGVEEPEIVVDYAVEDEAEAEVSRYFVYMIHTIL